MKAMKKFTLTVFCILAGCIFFLSGIWIYFQKSLDRVELGEGEHAASYQRHYLMISNDKDTGMWQSVYESASKEAEEKDAYVELLSPEPQMNWLFSGRLSENRNCFPGGWNHSGSGWK